MRKYANIITLAMLVVFFAACQREYQLTTSLSVTASSLKLSSAAGSTRLIVYSNTDWTVSLAKETEWASLNKLSGYGMNDIEFSYSANYGISRSVDLIISTADESVSVTMVQSGEISSPSINFARPSLVCPKGARTLQSPMSTNLSFCLEDIRAKAAYYNEDGSQAGTYEVGSPEGWISSYSVSEDKVSFTVDENGTGSDRKADIFFYVTDGSGNESRSTINLVQSALDASFSLSTPSGEYYANARSYKVPASQNNIWSSDNIVITATEPWVQDLSIDSDGLAFRLERNQDGSPRSAIINLSLNEEGSSVNESFSLTQFANMKLSFEELRALPDGQLTNDDILEGFIVSDPQSVNLYSSPQTGQYSFDRSENTRTAYLESEDGLYGVMLKFDMDCRDIVRQFAKVQVNLNGARLSSASNPARYVLSGLEASSITELAEPDESAVPVKKRTVGQLSENDIYTLVSLQGMEIMQKDGSYTNCSDAYSLKDASNPYSGTDAPWWDVAPLLCHDRNGDALYILTNAAAPWRRNGVDLGGTKDPIQAVVPQGSGEIKGILVADEVAPVRYGNLGSFQLRPMQESDIALHDAAYTTTIVEWNWNDFSPAITPTVGSGTLDVSGLVDAEGKTNAAVRTLSCDYNNTYNGRDGDGGNGNGGTNMAGLIKNGAMKLTKSWWNFSRNEGEFFDIKFNTAGVSATNLFVGIVWGHGEGASAAYTGPAHWKALYSINGGSTWEEVPGVGIIGNRSCICADNYSVDACPGFTEHLIKLPTACFGKSDVRVRLQVADTVCDAPAAPGEYSSAFCIGQGNLSSSVKEENCQVILGTVTVRYN